MKAHPKSRIGKEAQKRYPKKREKNVTRAKKGMEIYFTLKSINVKKHDKKKQQHRRRLKRKVTDSQRASMLTADLCQPMRH